MLWVQFFNRIMITCLHYHYKAVLRSRINFMRLRLQVKILMRLRLLPYCIEKRNDDPMMRLWLRNTVIKSTGIIFMLPQSMNCVRILSRWNLGLPLVVYGFGHCRAIYLCCDGKIVMVSSQRHLISSIITPANFFTYYNFDMF
jgi:hypothetical protein